MGGRGTYAAGNHVAYQYETIGYVEGVKVLQLIDKNKTQKLPEESQSSNAYIKLNKDGSFCQYREFNDKHELVLEIGYHPEEIVTYTRILLKTKPLPAFQRIILWMRGLWLRHTPDARRLFPLLLRCMQLC